MTTRRFCPPPSQARDPGFLQALRTDEVAALVQQELLREATLLNLTPDYVRWKDSDGSLVGFRASVQIGPAVVATYVTARTAPPARLADEADRLRHRAEEDHAGLRAFAFVPAANLLLLAFPIDRALPDLRRLVRASKVRSLVEACCPALVPAGHRFSKSRSACALVSYRPERRAVLHWRVGLVGPDAAEPPRPSIWVRCHAEPLAARTAAATQAAAAVGVRAPRTLAIAHDRLMFESHVDGRVWAPGPTAERGFVDAAARVVAQLHTAAPPHTLPLHHALAELDLVLAAVDDLRRLDPWLGSLGNALADRLSRDVPPSTGLVLAHGDLHPGQVLLGAEGGALVDFDRACAAPVAHDLATLIAQCAEIDPVHGLGHGGEFVAAYGRCAGLPDPAELAWWTGCALVRNATRPFRRLRPDWRDASATLLGLATRVMQRPAVEGAWS